MYTVSLGDDELDLVAVELDRAGRPVTADAQVDAERLVVLGDAARHLHRTRVAHAAVGGLVEDLVRAEVGDAVVADSTPRSRSAGRRCVVGFAVVVVVVLASRGRRPRIDAPQPTVTNRLTSRSSRVRRGSDRRSSTRRGAHWVTPRAPMARECVPPVARFIRRGAHLDGSVISRHLV